MMETELEKTLDAIKTAIQMEIDGKRFYLKASRESSNELGKKLLETLAEEEDSHRQQFEQVYGHIQTKNDWPDVDLISDNGGGLRTVFAMASEEIGSNIDTPATELDAVQTAIEMENKTHSFYKLCSQNSNYEAEKDFYRKLATIEKEHHLVLLDYYEFLKDPAEWFVAKEHPSLDGG